MTKKRVLVVAGVSVALLAAAMCAALTIGTVPIPFRAVWEILGSSWGVAGEGAWPESYTIILMDLRLPRVCAGVVVGAALACAGLMLQTILRNPLGDPYLLGVSSGAGFGAALAIGLGWPGTVAGVPVIPLTAFAAALLTMLGVIGLVRTGGRLPVSTLVLAGVVLSALLSSFTVLIATLAEARFGEIFFWLMGHVEVGDGRVLVILAIAVGGSILAASLWSRQLNALSVGEATAASLGVRVEAVKLGLIVLSSLMTAAAVSVAGLIGFVGLVVPHAARFIVGSDHRALCPAVACGGGMLLVLADACARRVVAPSELPVGIITALVGAPFFLILLKRQRALR